VPLAVERRDRVAVLTLDDPPKRNALGVEMVEQIVAAVTAAEADDDVGALIVTGAPPAFCSGADRSNLAQLHTERGGDPGDVRGIYEGFLSVRDCPLPTVAAVNGPAVGAGFNLAMCCDVILAAESARFEPGFTKIGIHPGGGHTWMLERAIGPHAAAAVALFGERVDAPRAVEIGLVWRCLPDDALFDEALALATRVSELPRDLAIAIKATLREVPWQPDFEAAVTAELDRQKRSFGGS
jgi:enoyl-CoA hydratase